MPSLTSDVIAAAGYAYANSVITKELSNNILPSGTESVVVLNVENVNVTLPAVNPAICTQTIRIMYAAYDISIARNLNLFTASDNYFVGDYTDDLVNFKARLLQRNDVVTPSILLSTLGNYDTWTVIERVGTWTMP